MLGHRKMSEQDKSKETVTAEGQNTTATQLRMQKACGCKTWPDSKDTYEKSCWTLELLRVTGQQDQGQEIPWGKYIWRPVQRSGSIMLSCLEAGKGGRSGPSLAQGGSAQARSGVQGTFCRSHQANGHQLSWVFHGWCTTAHEAPLPLGLVR